MMTYDKMLPRRRKFVAPRQQSFWNGFSFWLQWLVLLHMLCFHCQPAFSFQHHPQASTSYSSWRRLRIFSPQNWKQQLQQLMTPLRNDNDEARSQEHSVASSASASASASVHSAPSLDDAKADDDGVDVDDWEQEMKEIHEMLGQFEQDHHHHNDTNRNHNHNSRSNSTILQHQHEESKSLETYQQVMITSLSRLDQLQHELDALEHDLDEFAVSNMVAKPPLSTEQRYQRSQETKRKSSRRAADHVWPSWAATEVKLHRRERYVSDAHEELSSVAVVAEEEEEEEEKNANKQAFYFGDLAAQTPSTTTPWHSEPPPQNDRGDKDDDFGRHGHPIRGDDSFLHLPEIFERPEHMPLSYRTPPCAKTDDSKAQIIPTNYLKSNPLGKALPRRLQRQEQDVAEGNVRATDADAAAVVLTNATHVSASNKDVIVEPIVARLPEQWSTLLKLVPQQQSLHQTQMPLETRTSKMPTDNFNGHRPRQWNKLLKNYKNTTTLTTTTTSHTRPKRWAQLRSVANAFQPHSNKKKKRFPNRWAAALQRNKVQTAPKQRVRVWAQRTKERVSNATKTPTTMVVSNNKVLRAPTTTHKKEAETRDSGRALEVERRHATLAEEWAELNQGIRIHPAQTEPKEGPKQLQAQQVHAKTLAEEWAAAKQDEETKLTNTGSTHGSNATGMQEANSEGPTSPDPSTEPKPSPTLDLAKEWAAMNDSPEAMIDFSQSLMNELAREWTEMNEAARIDTAEYYSFATPKRNEPTDTGAQLAREWTARNKDSDDTIPPTHKTVPAVEDTTTRSIKDLELEWKNIYKEKQESPLSFLSDPSTVSSFLFESQDHSEDSFPDSESEPIDAGWLEEWLSNPPSPQCLSSNNEVCPEALPDAYETVAEWATHQATPPTLTQIIFQLRNQKVAAHAAAGKSRWGNRESMKADSITSEMYEALAKPLLPVAPFPFTGGMVGANLISAPEKPETSMRRARMHSSPNNMSPRSKDLGVSAAAYSAALYRSKKRNNDTESKPRSMKDSNLYPFARAVQLGKEWATRNRGDSSNKVPSNTAAKTPGNLKTPSHADQLAREYARANGNNNDTSSPTPWTSWFGQDSHQEKTGEEPSTTRMDQLAKEWSQMNNPEEQSNS